MNKGDSIVIVYGKGSFVIFHNQFSFYSQGKLVAREHVTKGFENMREAFYGLFKGENIGKAIVQV